MTSAARGSSRTREHVGIETPFDWSDQALAHPRIFVIGPAGSGKRQYLASLPYAPVDWESRENIIGVVPAGSNTIARMANALYYPGEISDDGGPTTYNVFVRQRAFRRETALAGKHATLADIPSLVFRDPDGPARLNSAVWYDNAPITIAGTTLPVQEHVATAIGLLFVIDPFTRVEHNSYVADLLDAVESVYAEWREAGVSSLPSGDRRVPVAVVATKTDALHPGDPRLNEVVLLQDLIGQGQADRVNATQFSVHCCGVSAWGEGPGVRYSGTRFDPTDVLLPLREMFRGFPRLLGTRIWDLAQAPE